LLLSRAAAVVMVLVGRIRETVAGGAWCPSQPISKDSTEYLEVDLGRLMVVTLVETQGRFDNGQVGDTAVCGWLSCSASV